MWCVYVYLCVYPYTYIVCVCACVCVWLRLSVYVCMCGQLYARGFKEALKVEETRIRGGVDGCVCARVCVGMGVHMCVCVVVCIVVCIRMYLCRAEAPESDEFLFKKEALRMDLKQAASRSGSTPNRFVPEHTHIHCLHVRCDSQHESFCGSTF